jgi:hypothetical protein
MDKIKNIMVIWVVGRGIYALNYIRTCSQPINLITTDFQDFAGLSSNVSKVYYIKFDESNPDNYCKHIEKLVGNGNDLVIGIGEETLYLDNYIEKTNGKMNLFGLQSSKSRLHFHPKDNFMKLIGLLGLPLISTWYPNDIIKNPTPKYYLKKLIKSRGGDWTGINITKRKL